MHYKVLFFFLLLKSFNHKVLHTDRKVQEACMQGPQAVTWTVVQLLPRPGNGGS
jgi:hypothetical protein